MNEVTTKKKCKLKCSGSERRDASTSEGQCDTATNTLKAMRATIGRVKTRAALSTAGGETSALRSQRGVPINNSGGAIRENTMCCTIWTESYLFSVHMVQHMVFSLIAPPLLLMGTPRWLLSALVSPPAVLRAARVLTRPIVALIAFNVFVAVSHWPSLVDASLRSEPLHFSLHFFLVVTSFMMWSPVVGRVEELPRLSPPAKMLYLFLQSVLPTVPASFLTFAERPIYHFYETVPHPWIDALTDNRIAGLTMKLGGGALLWGIIAVLFFKWHADEEASMEPSHVDGETWDDFERELEAWNMRT